MTNDLAWQLKTNEALWQRWLDFGVTHGAEFEVEFHFYTTKEGSADALIRGLAKVGFTAKKSVRRTLFVVKDWYITVTISRPWTLEALNDQTRQFCRLADMLRLTFDGCGAYMPS
jgi:Regulator of ribonuclease activity B